MNKKILEMKQSLEESLNYYIDHDDEIAMLAVQGICLKFFEIFENE